MSHYPTCLHLGRILVVIFAATVVFSHAVGLVIDPAMGGQPPTDPSEEANKYAAIRDAHYVPALYNRVGYVNVTKLQPLR